MLQIAIVNTTDISMVCLRFVVTNVPDISGTCGPKLVTAAEAVAAAAAGQPKKSSQDEWA